MKRLLTAFALIGATLGLVFWAPSPIFEAAAVLMGFLCYREYSDLVSAHGIQRPGVFGILAGLLIQFSPQPYVLIGMTLLVLMALIMALRAENLRNVLPKVSSAFLGAVYTFAPWRFATELRSINHHLLAFALALNWAGDSVAYYVGRSFGKHKLAPIVSPKKSWEGAAASVMGSVIFGLLYLGHFMPGLAVWKISIMAVLANVAGQFGDLAESAVKRGAGVKDSGQLLPGHGGMLDRVDSSLFALPLVYVFVLIAYL